MQSRAGLGSNKHMHINHMYLQQLVARRVLTITKIATEVDTSDLGTKYLDRARFDMLSREGGHHQRRRDDEHQRGGTRLRAA